MAFAASRTGACFESYSFGSATISGFGGMILRPNSLRGSSNEWHQPMAPTGSNAAGYLCIGYINS